MLVEVLYLLVTENSFNFGWQNLVVPNVKQSWTNNGARFYQRDAGNTWDTWWTWKYTYSCANKCESLAKMEKKLYYFLFVPISGCDTKLTISLIHNMFKYWIKGVSFLRNCGGSLVGEDNKVILISSTVDNVY